MEEFDQDLTYARRLKRKKQEAKERDFSKLLNKKDLNSIEMDQMFLDLD